jgi:hypothetical protein
MNCQQLPRLVFLAAVLFLAACTFEAPITEKPTGKIDERLLGDWLEKDTTDKHLIVSKWDDSQYAVQYGGLYRAFHSDFGGVHFVSVQNIESPKDTERKFAFITYELQDDGKKLVLRSVNNKVISDKLRTTAEIQTAIQANLKNPQLINEEPGIYTKVK